MLQDSFRRTIDTLRISVTDRCNFRCRYCMPPEGIALVPKWQILTFDEIERIARSFISLGGKKIRLTGGEPLLRRNIELLVAKLAQLPGIEDLGLTTNGSLLKQKAHTLKRAGLVRINLSLDSLNKLRFQWLAAADQLGAVMEGLESALDAGLSVKLNTVVINGITKHDVFDLVSLAIARDLTIRFIEFMPLCGTGWRPELCFPIATVEKWIRSRWLLSPLPRGSDPAETYEICGTKGCVGFIASLSRPFCGTCSRIRLMANGTIRPCLFSNIAFDLKPHLAGDDEQLMQAITDAVAGKPEGHIALSLDKWDARRLPFIQNIGG